MRIKFLISLIILLATAKSYALPGVLSAVNIGQTSHDYQTAMAANSAVNTIYQKDAAQPFAQMILATQYLSLMNKTGEKHQLVNADFFIFSKLSNDRYFIAAINKDKVSSIYGFYPTFLIGNPFSENNLAKYHEVINLHRSACSLNPIYPKYRNNFNYKGTCGSTKFRLEYYPEANYAAAVYY